MRHHYCGICGNIGIRALSENDLELLRTWRNDKELSKYLTPIPEITKEMQLNWYQNYLKDEDVIFFAVIDMERDQTIGTVALYNFEKEVCKVGKIVIGDATERGRNLGYRSLLLAMKAAIIKLDIQKFMLQVCEDNAAAYRIYQKAGFHETGRHDFVGDGLEIDMEIDRETFEAINPLLKDMVIYEENSD
ncbi:MAG: GNAT family N-acetyltransferase [Ruminococcus flavefaciens]|nr:GNAT family N-acetyltransferase [Ruminococcus flavefaciens]